MLIEMVGWKPPLANMVKLNMDEACKENNRASYGEVIRDNRGYETGRKYTKRLGLIRVKLNVNSMAVANVLGKGVSKSITIHAMMMMSRG
ncbi:hypothetical protein KIW84_054282 [Lathyrus oleraceus]|uniref:Uncharacterized protein n=1 Tax=Pisum sativum TaxID=3888 RepID=A0A9D4WSP0_PEA|nr:hypothetical protein KIW84_054282 [Pisum sativum]